MSSTRLHNFIRDDSGGYTIWSLIWFSLYVAMGGLAVDVTEKPLIQLVWFGLYIILAGGALAIVNRLRQAIRGEPAVPGEEPAEA